MPPMRGVNLIESQCSTSVINKRITREIMELSVSESRIVIGGAARGRGNARPGYRCTVQQCPRCPYGVHHRDVSQG